jgi:hypothetical protein
VSQSSVLDYVETRIETISSTPSGTLPCRQGIGQMGLPTNIAEYPLVVISARNMEPEQLTAGVGGTVHEKYAVIITLYLAPKDTAHDVVVARGKLFPGRMRAKFTPDWKLGGNCWNSDLRGPADNLGLNMATGKPQYIEANAYPIHQWALMVTEETTANAVAP